MRSFLLFLILSGICTLARADNLCQRLPMDSEFPPGLDGHYEIIGRHPTSNNSYTGTLTLSNGKTSYTLTHAVQGKSTTGEAWLEQCGPDKIKTLVVHYHTAPATQAACTLAT